MTHNGDLSSESPAQEVAPTTDTCTDLVERIAKILGRLAGDDAETIARAVVAADTKVCTEPALHRGRCTTGTHGPLTFGRAASGADRYEKDA